MKLGDRFCPLSAHVMAGLTTDKQHKGNGTYMYSSPSLIRPLLRVATKRGTTVAYT